MDTAVECFLITVRPKYKMNVLPLDNLDGKGGSIVSTFEAALRPYKKTGYNALLGKTARIHSLKKDATNCQGIIKYGEHGFATDVIDVNTGATAYSKGKHHADTAPFYFRMTAPVGSPQGMLAIQRLGQSGVKGILISILRDDFAKKFSNLTLDVKPLVPDYVMGQYLKGGTPKHLTFVKHSIPADLADVVSGKSQISEGRVEIKVSASDAGFFRKNKISAAIIAKQGVNSVYAIDKLADWEPDEVKLTVDVGGVTRTVNLNNIAKLKASFDISGGGDRRAFRLSHRRFGSGSNREDS